MRGYRLVALLAAGTFTAWIPVASAQEPPKPSATPAAPRANGRTGPQAELEAEKLFLEGRALLRDGKSREACELLERSHKLVPTLGTLLNLGLCHRDCGHLSTAHDYYRQAEIKATLAGDTVRREFAHNEAATIASRRATLALRIPDDAGTELDVRIDDAQLPPDAWGRPMFIDAGEHRITVESRGQRTWEGSVVIVDGDKHVVVLPELSPPGMSSVKVPHSELPAPESGHTPEPKSSAVALSSPPKPRTGLGTTRIVALSVGGAGVVALGASAVFAIAAQSSYDGTTEACRKKPGDTDTCSNSAVRERENAMAHAARSTVFAVAGIAAVAGGVVLWFVGGPSDSESRERVSLSPGGDGLVAAWTRRF